MSRTESAELEESIGNISQLLANKGRSSTPGPPNKSKLQLADFLRISYHSANAFHPKLNVATIVHDELYDEIEKKYAVFPLLPSCLTRSINTLQPKLIVIHRSAFHEGPWFGTEEAAGGTSVDLVRRIMPWTRMRQVPVLFLDNGMPDLYYTAHLREIGTELFPHGENGGRVPEGAPRSAIYEIAQKYSGIHRPQATNVEG